MEQLKTAADDIAKAEWALAVWAVASGTVIDSLFTEWEQTVQDLGAECRAVMLRSASQVASYGWLRKRSITATSSDPIIGPLVDLRIHSAGRSATSTRKADGSSQSSTKQASLLSVARSAKWLKVDTAATYR